MPGYRRAGRLTAAVAMGATALLALAACSSTPSGTTTSAAPASSAAAAAITAAPKCSDGGDLTKTVKMGAFLPLTGSLSFLSPASIGGVDLAISDINAAGGALGKDVCLNLADSSDSSHGPVSIANIKKLISSDVSAIVGPESSGVTLNVLPTINSTKNVLFSNAATSDALTGISPWFFRNPAPNKFEAEALGNIIVADGFTKVGFLVQNDPYATNLRDGIQKVITAGGGTVTYGATGKNQEYKPTETDFSGDVSSVLATKPDAIVLDSFDEAKQIIPELKSAGWTMKNTYFIDGDLNDYSKDFPAGTLDGAKGTTQGKNPSDDLKAKILAAYVANGGSKAKLTSYGYGAEAYDATVLIALAAEKAKSGEPADIQKALLPVSGSTGGTKCTTYAACSKLLADGKEIAYSGYTGIGALNSDHQPSSAYISAYQFVGNNGYGKFLGSTFHKDQ